MKLLAASLVALSLALAAVPPRTALPPQAADADAPPLGPPDPADPALLRKRLLDRMDARIDAMATRMRLELRLALDEVYPLSFLGVDSKRIDGRLELIAVYAGTGAEAAGLRVGDVVRSLGGTPTPSRDALARAVRARRVGERVEVAIERDGRPAVLHAVLGRRPVEDEDFEEQFPDLFLEPPPLPPVRTLDFELAEPGRTPAELESVLGGVGRPGAWNVVASDGGRALRQADDDPTSLRFPMVLARDWEGSDVVARVRFRYVGGRGDRAAGIVLRYRDPGNYLVARANAGEADLRIFRVANGDRRTLPGARVAVDTADDAWHELEFRAEGPQLTAVLDGSASVTAWDSYFLRGRAGLWTKADALTEFDDLRLAPAE